MLLELTIRNIALIESLRIEFAQGFNVLTGETGAGESIVNMEAVGNLMVIKTLSASAAAACEAIDSMKWNEVLGTIAGDNTVLIIGRSPEAIEIIQNRFHNLLKR